MKRSSKKLNKDKKEKEKNFMEHWNPYEGKRDYDALEDPHAKYYFYNRSISQHLKSLKKVQLTFLRLLTKKNSTKYKKTS